MLTVTKSEFPWTCEICNKDKSYICISGCYVETFSICKACIDNLYKTSESVKE
jgi:hypothetical protein